MKKQSGLKNEQRAGRILVSGSAILPQPNNVGIRVVRKQKPKPAPPIIKGYPDLSDSGTDSYGNLSEAGLLDSEYDGGIIGGQLIRPKYDNIEIEKSVDTEIFELIPKMEPLKPPMVPKPIYDDVVETVNDLTLIVQQLSVNITDLTAKVSSLEIVSESLRVEVDGEKNKAQIATQRADLSNQQVGETTIDLQNAIQNSINEAIQRVSLTARNEALEESFKLQKELTEAREKQNAAQTAVEGINGFFQNTENAGWKISSNDIKDEGVKGLFIRTYNDDDIHKKNGMMGVAFFNFAEVEQTFTVVKIGGIETGVSWIDAPTSFKVPPRVGQTAGVTTANFRWNPINGGRTGSRRSTFDATFTITCTPTVPTEDTFTNKLELKAYMFKEVKRKDKWSIFGDVQTFVGEDKTGG